MPNSAEHCGRRKRVATFFTLSNVLNNISYHCKSEKRYFCWGGGRKESRKTGVPFAYIGY